jgi:hypothetical protein
MGGVFYASVNVSDLCQHISEYPQGALAIWKKLVDLKVKVFVQSIMLMP